MLIRFFTRSLWILPVLLIIQLYIDAFDVLALVFGSMILSVICGQNIWLLKKIQREWSTE